MSVNPETILDYLRTEAGRPLRARELAHALGVKREELAAFRTLLREMESEGALYRVQRQRYAAPARINLVVGRVRATRRGAAFVIPDEGGQDVFVSSRSLGSALDGDRVVVRVERHRDGKPSGTVIRVLERARETIVGTYHPPRPPRGRLEPGPPFVVPADPRIRTDLMLTRVPEDAQEGDLVVARVSDWGDRRRGPAGVVERVLGRVGETGVDILAIVHGHELPVEFPPPVEREAEALRAAGIPATELSARTDLRAVLTFTIDPSDAKDHDDALSIEEGPAGTWDVGVHIADVSHYVRPGSALDDEAFARGTSVYLVDRVLPMLPHALSSDLCSLVPDQDRLTCSTLLRVRTDGSIESARLEKTVIRSRHRLTYEHVQTVLDGAASIDAPTDEALRRLSALARVLRARRSARGSLDFDLPESRVVLSAAGEPTDIQKVIRLESHRLIEDFMLLANETVAVRATEASEPFVYRIHEAPGADRIEALSVLAAAVGVKLDARSRPRPADLRRLLEAVRGRPSEPLISMAVLRSMKQARYSDENEGHFGLAADAYTHFTSPIRRYPDLVVHRLCWREVGRAGARDGPSLAEIARHSSDRERVAVEAERDSIELKKVEFMERHLGDVFAGTISNVLSFGFFVLLDAFHVEGLVHVSSLEDDYYEFREERFELGGERGGRRFRLGDRVNVRVAAVHREDRRIDFVLADAPARPVRQQRGKRRRR